MQYYWSGGDVKKAEAEIFKGITLHGRYDVVEQSFAEASKLAPERLDFRFAVASSQILQKNVDGARATYEDILAKDQTSFEAQAWLEALARVGNDETEAALAHQGFSGLDRDGPRPIAIALFAPSKSWPKSRILKFRPCPAR